MEYYDVCVSCMYCHIYIGPISPTSLSSKQLITLYFAPLYVGFISEILLYFVQNLILTLCTKLENFKQRFQ